MPRNHIFHYGKMRFVPHWFSIDQIIHEYMKCVIFRTLPFPSAGAASNRYLGYIIGFLENKCPVSVISCRPKPRIEIEPILNGIIDWHYSPSFLEGRNKLFFWITKYFGLIWGIVSLICVLTHNRKDNSFVIVGDNLPFIEIWITAICRTWGVKVLKEESEHPIVYKMNKHQISEKEAFRTNQSSCLSRYRRYNGLLLMTNELVRYFVQKGFEPDKLVLIPQTVDISRFEGNKHLTAFETHTLTYIGSFSEKKDGILSLLHALKIVISKYPDLRIKLAGFGSEKEITLVDGLLNDLDMEDSVDILLNLSPESIPDLLLSSSLLLSCRPDSIQARYGFPTKIAEYMATGIPMVTTAYGDLKDLLIDGKNAFVSASSDPEFFADKVLEALENYDLAVKIAKNAKLLAKDKFDPNKQAKLILDFVSKGRI